MARGFKKNIFCSFFFTVDMTIKKSKRIFMNEKKSDEMWDSLRLFYIFFYLVHFKLYIFRFINHKTRVISFNNNGGQYIIIN